LRPVPAIVLVLLLAAGVAAAAWAKSIGGTPRADVIRGTARADVIHGRAGNDRLYGLGGADTLYGDAGNDKLYGGPGNDHLYGGPGNDVLVGGPGRDVIDCGPGNDTVVADSNDVVAGNCEHIEGLGDTTSTPTTTDTTPTTTTAPALVAKAGQYCGFADSGDSVCFQITGDTPQRFTKAHFAFTTDCTPSSRWTVTIDLNGYATVQPDLSFTYTVTSGNVTGTVFSGTLDTQGNAQGKVHVESAFDENGTHYTCAGDTTWKATFQG
jgi:Ca2+-binding RTX toxin-like protein